MICLHDTCVAVSPERHEAALACFRGYCDQITVTALKQILPCAYPSCG